MTEAARRHLVEKRSRFSLLLIASLSPRFAEALPLRYSARQPA